MGKKVLKEAVRMHQSRLLCLFVFTKFPFTSQNSDGIAGANKWLPVIVWGHLPLVTDSQDMIELRFSSGLEIFTHMYYL